MKEILIVLSGGRAKGNTAQLADAFMKLLCRRLCGREPFRAGPR